MNVVRISLPLQDADYLQLNPGDKVLLSGTIYTARDVAHRRLIEMIRAGKPLQLKLPDTAIFYCGPSPTPPGTICGAIGPTTSARMDAYTPELLDCGLKMMIGKGERSLEVETAIRQHKAVYLSCLGGVSAMLSQCIVSCETFLWPELSAEAVFKLVVKNLPAYVTII